MCRNQFLDEERVALAEAMDLIDRRWVNGVTDDRGDKLGGATAIESGQVPLLGPSEANDLGQDGSQRVATRQFIEAIRSDEQHRVGPRRPRQEREQRPRRRVGPVQILEDHHHRSPMTEPLERADHQLTQPVTFQRHRRLRCRPEFGHEVTKHGARATEHEVERLIVEFVDEAGKQLAQSARRECGNPAPAPPAPTR